MTYGTWEIVGRNDRELPIGTTIGDALRRLIARRFMHNAAKTIERRWGLDPKTARNVVQCGNVSERTLTKAAMAERWALWMALGEEIFEQSYAEFLQECTNATRRAAEDAAAAEDHNRGLEALAAQLVALPGGKPAAQPWDGAERSWKATEGKGAAGDRRPLTVRNSRRLNGEGR
jgi:hypothetical protein